ncbi:hypothetical protein IWQ60_010365 [Tieghemiomyces parasiticus]|uniref:Uncharacterized protein n=1 Tax=Tieghemiomyces parasiticus TaxID=78921 RepID=A0A9W7ZT72_9FUNG|nr:hypothetical protein IWQ60_010365 [Tieghemiomyces parasiticus]
MLGSILQGVLYTTVLISIYHISFDVVVIGQWAYYEWFYTPYRKQVGPSPTSGENTPLLTEQPHHGVVTTVIANENEEELVDTQSTDTSELTNPSPVWELIRTLGIVAVLASLCMLLALYNEEYLTSHPGLRFTTASDTKATNEGQIPNPLAQFFAWSSVALYLASRVPQIVLNYRKKSCDGLSLSMFVLTVVGNGAFAASIMVYSQHPQYLIINLPWILNSSGTVLLDVIIMGQFYAYHEKTANDAAAAACREPTPARHV